MWLSFKGTFQDFLSEGKSEPGVLIEVLIDEKPKQLLIGDISVFASVMNGDMLDVYQSQVLRYQYIWRRIKKRGI